MSGKMVRPHMGVKVGEEFVGQVKALMLDNECDRDVAIMKMVNQSKTAQYQEAVIIAYNQKMDKMGRALINQESRWSQENRKLYMVIAMLSSACVTLALM